MTAINTASTVTVGRANVKNHFPFVLSSIKSKNPRMSAAISTTHVTPCFERSIGNTPGSFFYYSDENTETFRIYLYKGDQIEGVSLKRQTKDKITETISYMTSWINQTPKGYCSYIPYSTSLLSYAKKDKSLILNFSDDFERIKESDKVVFQIVYSFYEQGFDTVFFYVNGKKSDTFNDKYSITSLLKENEKVFFFSNDNIVYPKTYKISDSSIDSFIEVIESYYNLDIVYEKKENGILFDSVNNDVAVALELSLGCDYSLIFL